MLAKLLGSRYAWPIDFGIQLADHQRALGSSKTIRGLLSGLMLASVIGALIGLGWHLGLSIGAAAMTGDLLSSFTKRRLHLSPSSRATGLDQIPESFFPFLVCRSALSLTMLDIALGVALFFAGEIVLSKIFYRLHLRDTAY